MICTKCRANYWLDETHNTCNNLTVVTNCSEYEEKSDHCKTCQNGFILHENAKSCMVNPAGEISCHTYDSTGTQCLKCKENAYLSNGICTSTDLISNCKYYLLENQCEECNTGYQLVNSQKELANNVVVLNYCFLKTIPNCEVEEEGQNSCITCLKQFKKITENGKSSCETVTEDHCDEYQGNQCIACSKGYYFENSACSEGDAITNCTHWMNKTQCKTCEAGWTLNSDRTECEQSSTVFNDSTCSAFQRN